MARVFVSHSSRDADSAARLKQWLVAQGFDAPFLDFDKHSGIPPGADWERTLYRELSTSEAMLIVQTPNWVDSKWCFAEFTQARALGKPIFPVIDAQPSGNLAAADVQALDLTRDREGGLGQLARELTRIALDAQGGFVWDAKRPPYPGLLAFQAEDAAVYFGRDDDIRRLIERLNARRIQGGAGIVALLGASGSGKSSLLRAGVLPRLARDKRGWIVVPPFRPQLHPLDELARVMAIAAGRPTEWRAVRDGLLGDDPVRALGDWVHDLRAAASANEAQVLLAVDQAEELWGTADPAEAKRFETLIAGAITASLPLMVVLAQRSDFLESLQRSESLGGKFEEFSLGPLPLTRVPQIIEGPARVAGLEVEDELLQEATRDAATDDALPLLAFALRELHDRFGQDGKLSIDEYRALGDAAAGLSPLENSVRKSADEVLAAAKPGEAELRALKDAFVPALVRVNDAGEYTRRPALWTDLPPAAHDLLERLVKARLLVRRLVGDANVIEVAHEALLRKWPRLRTWLDQQRTFLIGRQQLEQDLRDWQQASPGDQPKALLTGLKLARAENWLLERPQQLTPDERRFIQASVERARAEARRRARARLFITLGSAAAAVILGIAALYARQQSEQAVAERARALDLARVALATDWQERDASKSALILTELDNPDTQLITRKLGEILQLPLVRAELPHQAPVKFVAFSPDGSRIVTVAEDHGVRIWDSATGNLLTDQLPHEEAVSTAAMSPDSALVITVAGNAVRIWDAVSATVRQTWTYDAPVVGAAFLAEGKRVAIAAGQEVWIRDVETGAPVFNEPWRHSTEVTCLAIAPGQHRVATGTADGQISLWDASSGAAVDVGVSVSLKDVRQLAWSPTGSALAAVSQSGTALWDIDSGERWFTEEYASSAWFAPDGRGVVTASNDADFGIVWSPGSDGRLDGKDVPKGDGPLIAMAFRDDGTEILTLSGTGFITRGSRRAYSIYGLTPEPTVLTRSRARIGDTPESYTLAIGGDLIAGAFSPDGGMLATLSGTPAGSGRMEVLEPDRTIRVWDVDSWSGRIGRTLPVGMPALGSEGELISTVEGNVVDLQRITKDGLQPLEPIRHEKRVESAALSPDGTTLGILTDDNVISLHALSSGTKEPVKVIKAPSIGSIGFTTDGQLLWGEGGYEIAGVWDVRSRESILPAALADCGDNSETRLDPAGRALLRFCRDRTDVWVRRDNRFDGPKRLPAAYPRGVAISPTAAIVAVALDDAIEIWNTGSSDAPKRIGLKAGEITFSPDGSTIAAESDGTLAIIDTATGALRLRWDVGAVRRLEFASHGRLVITGHDNFGQDNDLKVWEVGTGNQRSKITFAGDALWNWKLDPTGEILMTWSDYSTRLWSVDSGEPLFTASFDHQPESDGGSYGRVEMGAMTPDGAYLITATDHETRVWAIGGKLLRQILRARAGGCLSPAFRETVLEESVDEARASHKRCQEQFGSTSDRPPTPSSAAASESGNSN